jgi:hypothetical protein
VERDIEKSSPDHECRTTFSPDQDDAHLFPTHSHLLQLSFRQLQSKIAIILTKNKMSQQKSRSDLKFIRKSLGLRAKPTTQTSTTDHSNADDVVFVSINFANGKDSLEAEWEENASEEVSVSIFGTRGLSTLPLQEALESHDFATSKTTAYEHRSSKHMFANTQHISLSNMAGSIENVPGRSRKVALVGSRFESDWAMMQDLGKTPRMPG